MPDTLTALPIENQKFYDRTLLERMKAGFHLYKDAQKRKIKKGNGTTISFRKFDSLPVPTNSLTEGVTPTGSKMNITEITATLKQEGDFIEASDVLITSAIDPIITEASELCGEQAIETLERRIRDVIKSGTNVHYAGGKTSTSALKATDILTATDIEKILRTLSRKNTKKFEDGYYHAIIHPDQAYDLRNTTKWLDASKYAVTTQLLDNEIGRLSGFRFMESTENVEVVEVPAVVDDSTTDADETAAAYNIYKALFYGKNAYGVTDIEGMGAKPNIIIKPVGSSGTADPLNQRGTVGWKAMFVAVIINQNAIVRYETSASL